MVKQINKDNEKLWKCEECGFAYREKSIAEKCEDWCKKYHSCNVEIIKNAIKI